MRVVAVHTDFRLYWHPRLRRLSEVLQNDGHSLTVLEVANAGGLYEFTSGGFADSAWNVLFPGRKVEELAPRAIVRALLAKLEELQPDVVLAGAVAFPSGTAAIRWCRRRKRGVIIMDDVRVGDVPRRWYVNAVKRRFYINADAALVPSPAYDESYVYWGFKSDRIFHGLGVIDNAYFTRQVKATRESTGAPVCSSGEPFFLGVGRQTLNKNWLSALQAYKHYRHHQPDPWEFILVGNGPARANLEEYTRSNRLDGVTFLDFMDHQALCCYYATAGALILPTYHEPWGLVVNEAMACGLPVLVSSPCGCASTLVREGENGWTFDPRSPSQLGSLMLTISRMDPARRKLMGTKSHEIIERWGLDQFAEGALAAIHAVKSVRRGFCSLLDRCILRLWNGRYRPL